MTRRIAAFAGFLLVLSLAFLLLYRVYMHHRAAEPYQDEDEGVVVEMDDSAAGLVKIAARLS